MTHPPPSVQRLQVHAMDLDVYQDTFASDVARGLAASQKAIPAKYFYDARGSQLYERICQLPEYYPYRAERDILTTYAAEIYAEIGHLPLVELGSGSATKTRHLLRQYEQAGRPFLYCPVDISRSALLSSAERLLSEFPHLSIRALHTDVINRPDTIQQLQVASKAIAFFGSSLGNFTPAESLVFLRRITAIMNVDDAFVLGIDLKKSPAILVPAYDDAQGVTAAFNLNLLRRINRELGGDFDLDSFEHMALYNAAEGRIEMHLRSRTVQQVSIAKITQSFRFTAGETIHTENSYKYTVEEVRHLGRQAGLGMHRIWFDSQGYFLVCLFRRGESTAQSIA